ncbi:unnamed protein product [Linum trigynum]|uniref:Uncharacterized protein n=1 Tax=Linum trigynum TaxID=586398 RepID=A0AAV2DRS7_9ROSI
MTKHINVRYHFLRIEKRIKVKKVGTADNPADMFTKPVPHGKFQVPTLLGLAECLEWVTPPYVALMAGEREGAEYIKDFRGRGFKLRWRFVDVT